MMHHTDERTHANRVATPSKDTLYEMLLNNHPYTAKVLARMLIEWSDEHDMQAFIKHHNIYTFNTEVI